MITPIDIQEKEFPKAVRGYKEDVVDEFLDLITIDYESLLAENEKLTLEVERLKEDLLRYSGTENTVLETLEAAKTLMGDISASAERRAEILLKNAELDAELVLREAREAVERLTEENEALNNRFKKFKVQYKNLLESELERFDTLSLEIFEELGMAGLGIKEKGTLTEQESSNKVRQPSSTSDDLSKTLIIGSCEIKE
ncbi:MAG: DivIVA domain-containing protein [Anaerovoracaceae bacterium]|jgi:cell division initiation protein|nr:DivIVA domain-containing protein [Anaerovoracaceae bacterium]